MFYGVIYDSSCLPFKTCKIFHIHISNGSLSFKCPTMYFPTHFNHHQSTSSSSSRDVWLLWSSLLKVPSFGPQRDRTPSCCPLFSAVSLVLMGHAKNVNNNFICLSICIYSCVSGRAFLTLRLEVVPSTPPLKVRWTYSSTDFAPSRTPIHRENKIA